MPGFLHDLFLLLLHPLPQQEMPSQQMLRQQLSPQLSLPASPHMLPQQMPQQISPLGDPPHMQE